MDNPELIDQFEDELSQSIQKARKAGLSPETIGFILQETVKNLNLMAYAEAWLNQYAPRKPLAAP